MPATAWSFVVAGVPKPKDRPRLGRKGPKPKKGKPDTRPPAIFTPTKTSEFEMTVAAAAQEAGVRVGERACEVSVGIWLPTDAKRMDLDNVLKSVLDGLVTAGPMCLQDDDVHNVRRAVIEYLGADPVHPRTIVTIWVLPESGLRRLVRAVFGVLPDGWRRMLAGDVFEDEAP